MIDVAPETGADPVGGPLGGEPTRRFRGEQVVGGVGTVRRAEAGETDRRSAGRARCRCRGAASGSAVR